MCGITGFYDSKFNVTIENLNNSNNTLSHRGPDAGGTEIYNLTNAQIGFGHKRLSILDLSENGRQPMHSDDGNISIILNGEIYNFSEIKEELRSLGCLFKSHSDTEVVIKSYQQWGLKAVSKFIGMFAIALLDKGKNKLFLLRDRVGVKPLYYYRNEDSLLFASELKALHPYPYFKKDINNKAVSLFFKYGYIPTPHTIYNNTFKLSPGSILTLDISQNKIEIEKYYDIADYYNKPKVNVSEKELLEEIEHLLISAFKYRMVSDVPVGVFLSGGYDSSIVSAILQKNNTKKIKTFTIGFKEEQYNEAEYAKNIATYLGTDHHEYYCNAEEARNIIPILPTIFDEPFGDSSAIPTILVSRFAKEQVTVALSADGGDEIFAGYNSYDYFINLHKKIQKIPAFINNTLSTTLSKTGRFSNLYGLGVSEKILKLSDIIKNKDSTSKSIEAMSKHYSNYYLSNFINNYDTHCGSFDFIESFENNNDFLNKFLFYDYKAYLPDDILVKIDRATMSVGLEGREPLLDHRIAELLAQVPTELKYKNGNKKYLLKKITHQYIPSALLNRPKSGFSIPIDVWLRKELKDLLFANINDQQLSKHHFFNTSSVIKIRNEFIKGEQKHNLSIWFILIFQMWWNKWM
jgi:asparagine synthase (glutamine-hydrolysing)